jgi:hypothetical protein
VSLDPWMIEELEEQRRREEEERARQSRIELPQTRPAEAEEKPRERVPTGRVQIVDISPSSDSGNVIGI